MKRLLEIFSKKRNDENLNSQETKEKLEAKSSSTNSSHDSISGRNDLFSDDGDLGFC